MKVYVLSLKQGIWGHRSGCQSLVHWALGMQCCPVRTSVEAQGEGEHKEQKQQELFHHPNSPVNNLDKPQQKKMQNQNWTQLQWLLCRATKLWDGLLCCFFTQENTVLYQILCNLLKSLSQGPNNSHLCHYLLKLYSPLFLSVALQHVMVI